MPDMTILFRCIFLPIFLTAESGICDVTWKDVGDVRVFPGVTGTVTLHEPVFHTNEKLIADGVIINESPDEISATVVFEVVRASDGEMFGRNVSSDVFPPRMSLPFSNSLSTSAWTPGEYEVRLWIGKNDPTERRLLDLKTFTLTAPE